MEVESYNMFPKILSLKSDVHFVVVGIGFRVYSMICSITLQPLSAMSDTELKILIKMVKC